MEYKDEASGIVFCYWKDNPAAMVKSGTGDSPGSPDVKGQLTIPSQFEIDGFTYHVASLGQYCFTKCDLLESVIIPGSVKTVGWGAFQYCNSLKSVVLENGVEQLKCYAFSDCPRLQSLSLPATIQPWDSFNFPFYYCPQLADISVDNANPLLDSRYGCNAIIETGSNTLLLGGCNTVIPDDVTAIGDWAFQRRELSQIILPPRLKSIGRSAFSQCIELTSIVLPPSMESIGEHAFFNCIRLKEVTSLSYIPYDINNAFYDGYNSTTIDCTLLVPYGCKDVYAEADTWKDFKKIEEMDKDEVIGVFPRKVVVEEGAATWCPWCPRGIVVVNTMLQRHPDTFIPIAVHVGDEMEAPSYKELSFGFIPAFRFRRGTCVNNPNYGSHYVDLPLAEDLFSKNSSLSVAKVSMTAKWADEQMESIDITATALFSTTMSRNYKLAFVITENNVGPYPQSNGYAGSTTKMEGFENEPENVEIVHNHVARYITDLYGSENTIPDMPKAGQDYVSYYNLCLPDNVSSKDNIELTALLIDQQTLLIENACRIDAAEIMPYYTEAITEVKATNFNNSAFSLDGCQVVHDNALQHGLYIVRGKKILK